MPRGTAGGDAHDPSAARSEACAAKAGGSRRVWAAALAIVAGAALVPSGRAQAQALVIVNRIDDLPFGTWSGSGQMQQTMRHCVGSTSLGNRFNVRATGSGSGGAFTVASGANLVAYTVEYRSPTSGAFQPLTPGVPRGGFVGTTTINCSFGLSEPAELRVIFSVADLTAARAGTYSGVLTLTVAPE